MTSSQGHGFSEPTLKTICSTVDFFLDFDEETVSRLHETLWKGYALWHQERQKCPVESAFKERARLVEIPNEDKKPWDWGDVRASNPIRLLNHLWSIGHFREDQYLIWGLKAFAIVTSLKEEKTAWKNEILEEVMLLQKLEKQIHKKESSNRKEALERSKSGLKQNANNTVYHRHRKQALIMLVHNHATRLLNKNCPPRNVIGKIHGIGIEKPDGTGNITDRTIRRYLETHESGNWIPKSQKIQNKK